MAIDPRRLLELRHIARLGSFSRAAATIGISQPGLSKNVSVLERAVGARVLERGRRGSRLTEMGQLLLRHSEGLDALLNRAAAEVEELKKGLSGSLTIGVSPVATASLVPRALAALLSETPNISTVVYEKADDELIRELRSGEIDLVVSSAGTLGATSDIRTEVIIRDHLAVIVRRGHPLSCKRKIRLRDLRSAQWVVPDAHTAMYRQTEALFAAQGESWPRTVVSTNSINTLKSLLMWSNFVTICSTVLVKPEIDAGYVTALTIHGANPSREITVRTRTQPTPSALVQRFVTYLREAASC